MTDNVIDKLEEGKNEVFVTTRENQIRFRHVIIDDHTIGTGNSICLVADVNGNGFNDVIIGNCESSSRRLLGLV